MGFYINCACKDNHILLVHHDGEEKKYDAIHFKPSMFVRSKNKLSPYRNIYGTPLEKKEFGSVRKLRSFTFNHYQDSNAEPLYGNTNHHCVYLSDKYTGQIDYEFSKLTIVCLDIEVASANGFPKAELAQEQIVAITMKVSGPGRESKKNVFVFGVDEYNNTRKDVVYKQFDTEKELILAFIEKWEKLAPDIVTGWYIEYFDIPYIINRICRIFSERPKGVMTWDSQEALAEAIKVAQRLSPWEIIEERVPLTPFKDEGQELYEITGVAILDYMSLYKKFAKNSNQESYSLNHIAHVELGKKKMAYDEYGSLHRMYLENYQKFIDYNIKDVELVEELDTKLKLIPLAVQMAYSAKVNYYDVFSQVRTWDSIIYNHLKKKHIVMPHKKSGPNLDYPGAYVKEPEPGMYDWVASFDLDSMYPMIMAQWNISPETIADDYVSKHSALKEEKDVLASIPKDEKSSLLRWNEPIYDRFIESILDDTLDTSYLEGQSVNLSGSGHHFSNDKQGFLPEILLEMYEERKAAKKQAIAYKDQLTMVVDELKDRGIKAED